MSYHQYSFMNKVAKCNNQLKNCSHSLHIHFNKYFRTTQGTHYFLTFSCIISLVPAPDIASIDIPTAVGVTFAITFIISFSLGGLVTASILWFCYFTGVSTKATESPPSIPTAATYEVVGPDRKKIDGIELESNSAYGIA